MTTYDTLVGLLVERFEVDPAKVVPGATFEQLEMDSLFLVEFLLTIESDLGVHIDEDAASPSDTVEDAAALVDRQRAAAAAS